MRYERRHCRMSGHTSPKGYGVQGVNKVHPVAFTALPWVPWHQDGCCSLRCWEKAHAGEENADPRQMSLL